MKHLINFRSGLWLATGVGVGLFLGGAAESVFEPLLLRAHAQEKTAPKPSDVGDAQRDAPTPSADQSHVMADVGYHFANLWFAADKQNWPLANYYLSETRSHLRWRSEEH